MRVIIILLIFQEQLRLSFRATPWQKKLAGPTEVIQDTANRLRFESGATNLPRSTRSDLLSVE